MRFGMTISLRRASKVALFLFVLMSAVPSFGQSQFPPYKAPFDYDSYPEIHHQVPFYRQDTMAWCWVASAKMICEYYGRGPVPDQCAMLQMQYGAPCCENPGVCSRAGHLGEVQALIARFGGRASTVTLPADGFALYSALQKGPILMQTRQGAGHAVVATGMRIVPSPVGPIGMVSINDPLYGQYEIDFPSLIQAWSAAIVVY